jgi:hypothetical protein
MTLYHRRRIEKNNDCQSPRIEILKDKIRKKKSIKQNKSKKIIPRNPDDEIEKL